jgi:hypothetical protein
MSDTVTYLPVRHSRGTWVNLAVHLLLVAFVAMQAAAAAAEDETGWALGLGLLAAVLAVQVPMLSLARLEVSDEAITWRSRWRADGVALAELRRIELDAADEPSAASLDLHLVTRDDRRRKVPPDAVSGLGTRRNAERRRDLVTAIHAAAEQAQVPVRVGGGT